MERTPRPNEIYQHFKGNLYKVITLATHSETGESMVVYQALYGDFPVFVRPLEMFVSQVDHDRYPEAKAEYRFTLVPQILGQGSMPETEASRPFVPAEDKTVMQNSSGEQGRPAADISAAGYEAFTAEQAVPGSERTTEEAEEEEAVLDPLLLQFLDAGTYEDKLNIMVGLHSRITDEMLNTIAVSLDLELEEGELEERYQTLKNCLITLEKYECNRLR